MRRFTILFLLAAIGAAGQPSIGPWDRAISGTVISVTSAPVAKQTVSVRPVSRNIGTQERTAETDEFGRYKVGHLLPGEYVVSIKGTGMAGSARSVTVSEDKDATGVILVLDLTGELSGTVLDRDKKPILNSPVSLLQPTYSFGRVGYRQSSTTATDLQGRFRMQRVAAGSYLLKARIASRITEAISDEPADIDQRLPSLMPAYYVNSTAPEGAVTVSLQPGQTMEALDIRMERARSYCAEGIAQRDGSPISVDVELEDDAALAPTRSAPTPAGVFVLRRGPLQPRTGPDGKFRICGLNPGDYRLRATPVTKSPQSQPAAILPFSVFDRDLTNLRLPVADPIRLHGEIVWDGDPPKEPVTLATALHFMPLRPFAPSATASASVPGEFDVKPLAPDEYGVDIEVPHGYYAKDILYGSVSVLNRAFHVTESDRMHVVVARDGGAITARLADDDGVPIESAVVWFLPRGAATAADLAGAISSCITAKDGTCSSPTLRPGKYAVLGTVEHLGQTVAHMDRLFAGRSKGKDVELAANGSASVSLAPVVLF